MLDFASKKKLKLQSKGNLLSITGDEEFVMVDVKYTAKETRPALMNKATRSLIGLHNDALLHVSEDVLKGMIKHSDGTFESGATVFEFTAEETDCGSFRVK